MINEDYGINNIIDILIYAVNVSKTYYLEDAECLRIIFFKGIITLHASLL